MKKFGYVLAAVGAIAVAAPSIASAETVVIKRGAHHHQMGARRSSANTGTSACTEAGAIIALTRW